MRVYRRGHAGPENSNVISSYLFTYLFLGGQGLHCCVGLFSSWSDWGLVQCTGFPLQWILLLWSIGSRALGL